MLPSHFGDHAMAELSRTDKRNAFIAVTGNTENAKARWRQRSETGLTDDDLIDALRYELGIFGGSSKTESRPSITYQGAGLKIWAGWHTVNHCQEQPIFEGMATIKMACETFGIANPDDEQLSLL